MAGPDPRRPGCLPRHSRRALRPRERLPARGPRGEHHARLGQVDRPGADRAGRTEGVAAVPAAPGAVGGRLPAPGRRAPRRADPPSGLGRAEPAAAGRPRVGRTGVRCPQLRFRWLAVGAAVVVAALVAVAVAISRADSGPGTASGSHSPSPSVSSTGDPLASIPATLDRLGNLDPYLRAVSTTYPIPAGSAVTLAAHKTDEGSITLRSPSTWTDGSTDKGLLSRKNEFIGSELDSEVEVTRFYAYEVGGIFVGATQPSAAEADNLDSQFGHQQTSSTSTASRLGSSPSASPSRARPGLGALQWRAASSSSALLANSRSTVEIFSLATTRAEAEVLAQVLDSVTVDPAHVRAPGAFPASAAPRVTGDVVIP